MVHSQNCCSLHGCFYGEVHCPVFLGYQQQETGCSNDGCHGNHFVSQSEFNERRDFADSPLLLIAGAGI